MRFKDIQRLVKILETSSLSEIEITDFLGRRIKITKSTNNGAPVRIETPPQQTAEKAGKTEGEIDNLVAIKSPIVGTFYRSSAPDAPPYVEVGDFVKPGQVVCIIEAMKLMNEIESDIAGKIVKMLAKNEDPVEYNQKLFMVEPT